MFEKFGLSIKSETRTKWSFLFLIALLVYEIAAGLELTMLGMSTLYIRIGDVLKIISVIILLVAAVTHVKYYSLYQWITFGILGVLSAICTYTSKSAAPILVFLFWINMAQVELDDVLRVYLTVISLVFAFAFLMYLLGVFPDIVLEGDDRCIGFTHSNIAAGVQLCIVLTYMTLRYGKLRWFEWVLMAAFSIIVFMLTGSKCMIISSGLAIILGLILNCTQNTLVHKIEGILAIAAYPVFFVISYIVAIVYNGQNDIMLRINGLLKGRLALGASGIKDIGTHLLGQHVLWSSGDVVSPQTGEIIPYNIVDSAYLNILISYGWIYAIIIMILYVALAIYIYKKQKWNWSVAVIVILTCGLVEGNLITIVCNPVLIAIGTIFFSDIFAKKSEEAK